MPTREGHRSHAGPTRRRRALLVLAIGQPISIGVSALVGSSFGRDDPQGPVLVPVAGAFSIWGLIVLLTGAYAIWQAASGADRSGTSAVAGPLAITAAGFAAWVGLASTPDLTALTVPVFVAMALGLILAARATRRARLRLWPRWARGLLWAVLGTYSGWSAIALWLNLSTTLADGGAPTRGPWGTTWQILLAAAAAGTGVAILVFFRTLDRSLCWVFGATTVYALAFAAVGATTRAAPVAALAAASLALLVAATTCLVAVRARTLCSADDRTTG